MILDQIDPAWLQCVEHRLVEGPDIRLGGSGRSAAPGVVQVVVVLAGPDDVQLLRRVQRIGADGDVADIGADLGHGLEHLGSALGHAIRPEAVDVAAGADDVTQQARVVASARDQLADLHTPLDAGQGQHLGRLASRVPLTVGVRTSAVGHGGVDVGGNCGGERCASHQNGHARSGDQYHFSHGVILPEQPGSSLSARADG